MRTVLVFLATFITDVLWTLLVRRTTQGRALSASIYSTLIVLLSAVAITSFVENGWYVIPSALGAFAGTYLTVKIDGGGL